MATQTTTTSPGAWRPDVTEYLPGDVIPDALILTHAIVAGTIEGDQPSVRVPFVSDDGTAAIVAEGAEIADGNQDFDEAVVQTVKVAQLGKYSFETLQQTEAARLVEESLTRSVTRKANAAFLANASGPSGLLNVAGIVNGGAIGNNLDKLVDAIAAIEGNDGTATNIIAAPDAWASVSKLKTATASNQSLIGAGTETATRSLLSVPVTVSPAMPTGGILVIDRSAIVAAVGAVRLARSEDAFFVNDVIALRATFRLGWDVMRPNRIAKLTTVVSGS
ncbi:phage major capsid protein, HK97 [Mycolicibacterium conceptionense]|uniref:Phage major capsid protein, HK97 n=1 Tax=Mycolicibacterium conceptionense TaxID=451644 RepID=A0A0U1DNR5_9MYCO|nr:phage major capsid protein [Mycolicibacterium conceptionense]ORV25528.1 hypothetical protein AWB98_18040 [Mycolicibacterium conceptionense]CQD20036.1 phage major capsid protein, HK97 [Mycolicibacterium conceptionense]